jgi:nicotinic acid mononucleotide adenylyltransferase
MCTLAAEQTSSWLMVDPWEAFQTYQRTAVVLDHFDYEINTVRGGVQTDDGEQRNVRVMLLAGSDLISTMSEPGVWSYADVRTTFSPAPDFYFLIHLIITCSSITFSAGTALSSSNAPGPGWTRRRAA